jgi:hypothetical protein
MRLSRWCFVGTKLYEFGLEVGVIFLESSNEEGSCLVLMPRRS